MDAQSLPMQTRWVDDTELARVWADVEARYDQPSLHDAFIDACAHANRLNFASSGYRKRRAQNPADPVAKQRLAEIAARALEAVGTGGPQSAERSSLAERWLQYELVLALCALVFIGATALGVRLSPERQVDTCGGLLRGSPVCLAADVLFSIRQGLRFSVPATIAAFFGGLWLVKRLPF